MRQMIALNAADARSRRPVKLASMAQPPNIGRGEKKNKNILLIEKHLAFIQCGMIGAVEVNVDRLDDGKRAMSSPRRVSPRVWRMSLTLSGAWEVSPSVADSTRKEVDSNGVEAACSIGPLIRRNCDVRGRSIYTQSRADCKKILIELNFKRIMNNKTCIT
jgi:hypothetical protein